MYRKRISNRIARNKKFKNTICMKSPLTYRIKFTKLNTKSINTQIIFTNIFILHINYIKYLVLYVNK